MKVLLLLNGPEGWQTGIEDGFLYLKSKNTFDELDWFYFQDYASKFGKQQALTAIRDKATSFQPNIIIFFHIEKLPVTTNFIASLKELSSKPIIVYDEGDMYGGWAKPILNSLKIMFKASDFVSIRGLGSFYKKVHKYNKNIIYTPHHADIARFDKEPYILEDRKYPIILIGNKTKSRIPIYGAIRRMPGSIGRERFVIHVGKSFNNRFHLWGHNWGNLIGNHGPLDFQQQMEIYRNSWITVAYEHYPNIPFYFSNRLPIALLAGSLYVCHYHKGYESIFNNCDFIFFFKTNDEAVDIVNYLLSLNKTDLLARSAHAREFALKHFIPSVTWERLFFNILNNLKKI